MKLNNNNISCFLILLLIISSTSGLFAQSMKYGYKIDSHDDILDIVEGEEKVNLLLQMSRYQMKLENQEKGIEYKQTD